MAPVLVILPLGADPTMALVWSQVVLSFGIPFARAPLVWLTAQRRLMGPWVTGRRRPSLLGAWLASSLLSTHSCSSALWRGSRRAKECGEQISLETPLLPVGVAAVVGVL
ncbi:divalent metal cation transporter [Nocardioides caldifontis]|uniref:divalent metal cation transporter n=1 Tax=Nocardioides caldifontis TaxID=2588938 RepID=UPI001EF077F4|nr:divalent metal cation transporter [Nocardioides caldifontis]